MANNTMALATNRVVPWSNLGTNVSNCDTIEDVLYEANLNWNVEGRPIYDVNGQPIPGFLANTRTSDNEVLGIVTPRYEIVQNIDAFDFINNLTKDGLKFEMAGTGKRGKQIWILAKLPNDRDILGDAFNNYIVFTNAHDGTGAVKVCMTPIRVFCSNCLNLAFRNADRIWSARHSLQIGAKIEEAKTALLMADRYMDELAIQADILANTKISDSQIEQTLLKINNIDNLGSNSLSNRKMNNFYEQLDTFKQYYDMADIRQFKGTAWGVINAATDFADHASPMRNSANYHRNNWEKIINGHPFVDAVYREVG